MVPAISTVIKVHYGVLGRGHPPWKECHGEKAMDPIQETKNLIVERGFGDQLLHHVSNAETSKAS